MIRFSKSLFAAFFAGALFTGAAGAQQGDAAAGRTAAAPCAACHGADGNSPTDQFPNLAGQVPGYIAAQLAKFKSGERAGTVMPAMSAPLSDADMADLDAYYSGLEPRIGAITPEQEATALAGGKIYRGGFAQYNIPACMGCHGPSGHGIPPAFPRLSGQHAAYIEAELLAFKSGARADAVMNPIAFPLSAQQIKELALYISALH
ncbi:MAG: c-type cytochrome [bacterium]